MEEYGLREPEFVDMEIALRINLYRAENAAVEDAEKVPENIKRVPENYRISREKSIR